MTPERHRKKAAGASAAAILLAGTMIYSFEGERRTVYSDVVGIKTYCIGETRNPEMGRTYSHEECMKLLDGRLEEFNTEIDRCVYAVLTDNQRAALLSFTYNLGAGTMCNSSIVRNFNSGHQLEACNAFLLYNHAGKNADGTPKVIRGLTLRREAERKVCMGA